MSESIPWVDNVEAACEKLRSDKLYLTGTLQHGTKVYLTPHLIVDSHVPSEGVTSSYLHAWLANEKLAEAVLAYLLSISPQLS